MTQNTMPPPWTKSIPPARDRLQSRLLAGIMAPLLLAAAIAPPLRAALHGLPVRPLLAPIVLSLGFAALVATLRAATLPGAAVGLLVCIVLAEAPAISRRAAPIPVLDTAIPALILLFALTFLATRYGRAKKQARGLAEPRTGRRAAQVVANLGVAALAAAFAHHSVLAYAASIAALAEATADTLSSEIGQAVAGPAFLLTSLRRVPVGTDGAISLAGTIAGLLGAAAVIAVGLPRASQPMDRLVFLLAFASATAGLLFDSFLGATLERRGWLGNDLVNFASTAFSAAVFYSLALLATPLPHI